MTIGRQQREINSIFQCAEIVERYSQAIKDSLAAKDMPRLQECLNGTKEIIDEISERLTLIGVFK